MLTKFLITISLIFSPLISLPGQISQSAPAENLSDNSEPIQESVLETEENWNTLEKYHISAISSLWLANPNFLPVRDWGVDEPEISAKAVLISNIANSSSLSSKNKILYQKNVDALLSIASLTKLMTAIVVLENIDLGEEVIVSENAVNSYGARGGLVVNEKITVKNLLYVLLIESSNDAAAALAEAVQMKTEKNFIGLMNKKAEELDLKNTHFIGPSGYRPDNVSTARDLAKLVKCVLGYPLILEISRIPVIDLIPISGEKKHHLTNTNELLGNLSDIVGGKTGYTQEAQECLILIIRQSEKDYLVTVILGAQERFVQAQKLIEWVKKAYLWE
ncbi:MAG: serine hydrolase [Patescibacteria group bacterium]|nr:serine hydrolase [Patescibacteria group bacterium]